MSLILDDGSCRLLLGCVDDLANLAPVLSHILSVCSSFDTSSDRLALKSEHLHIAIDDSCDANIMDSFDAARLFLDEPGIETRGVLIHCQHGRSRSAAIMASLLMSKGQLSLDEAFDLLAWSRTGVQPNAGFCTQLWLYQELLISAGVLTVSSRETFPHPLQARIPPFIRLLRATCERSAVGSCAGFDTHGSAGDVCGLFVSGPHFSPAILSDSQAADLKAKALRHFPDKKEHARVTLNIDALMAHFEERAEHFTVYCCGRCNSALFSSHNVVYDGALQITASASSTQACALINLSSESGLFVEPMTWMCGESASDAADYNSRRPSSKAQSFLSLPTSDQLDWLTSVDEGKLTCPSSKCGAKLGWWSWNAVWRISGEPTEPASTGGEREADMSIAFRQTFSSPAFFIPRSRLIPRRRPRT